MSSPLEILIIISLIFVRSSGERRSICSAKSLGSGSGIVKADPLVAWASLIGPETRAKATEESPETSTFLKKGSSSALSSSGVYPR